MDNYTQKKVEFLSNSFDEKVTLYGDIFEPTEEDVKGIVEVVHGMAEHRTRYEELARFLATNGFICVIYDQRGHGETCGAVENQGYMSDVDNFTSLVMDVKVVLDEIKKLYPNKKTFILGHSMGSFVLQRFMEMYKDEVDGVILSGSNYTKSLLYKIGAVLAKSIVKKHGRKFVSDTLINMSFGSYNKAFKPNRTEYDWLSTNTENVDKYIADPYCGYPFTASYFMDLIVGFNSISKEYKKMNLDTPVYIFSGANDPVGNMSKGITKLYKKYKKLGIKDLSFKLYENGRHEMLNETNKGEVFNDVLEWLDKH